MQLLGGRPFNFTGIAATETNFFQCAVQDANANALRALQRTGKGDLMHRWGPMLAVFFEQIQRCQRMANPEAKRSGVPIGVKKAMWLWDRIRAYHCSAADHTTPPCPIPAPLTAPSTQYQLYHG